MKLLHPELSEKIEECFLRVYRKLGHGFLEKLYEKALCLELSRRQLGFELKPRLDVTYDGVSIGNFYPDMLIEGKIIVEIKSIENLNSTHSMQLLNYLSATAIELGYLVNFGPHLQVVRKVFTNESKRAAKEGRKTRRRPEKAG